MALLSVVPAKLLAGALAALALLVLCSAVLAWHGLRRVLDIPRVPRQRGIYWTLALTWGLAAAASAVTLMAALLLRDHQRLDGPTRIGELRCETAGPGRVRLELRAAAPSSAGPERYDVAGDACVVSVREVELRPGLRAFGVRALARVDGVGASARPTASPRWLTPDTAVGSRLLGLVVLRTRAVPVVVPPDPKQRFVLVATPGSDLDLTLAPERSPT
jgi:hypothetical protein